MMGIFIQSTTETKPEKNKELMSDWHQTEKKKIVNRDLSKIWMRNASIQILALLACQLCGFWQITKPSCASVSSSVKGIGLHCLAYKCWNVT